MNPYINQFHLQISSFLTDLEKLFMNDNFIKGEIVAFKSTYSMLKNINMKKPIEFIMTYLLPYKKEILAGDEQFFLNHDFTKEFGELSGDNSALSIILNFKSYYNKITKDDKEIIKKYFKVIVILGEKSLTS